MNRPYLLLPSLVSSIPTLLWLNSSTFIASTSHSCLNRLESSWIPLVNSGNQLFGNGRWSIYIASSFSQQTFMPCLILRWYYCQVHPVNSPSHHNEITMNPLEVWLNPINRIPMGSHQIRWNYHGILLNPHNISINPMKSPWNPMKSPWNPIKSHQILWNHYEILWRLNDPHEAAAIPSRSSSGVRPRWSQA